MKDLGYRIIAVLLAITLWVFVGMGSRFELGQRKLTIPIELKRPPVDCELQPVPASADLVLEGPVRALDRLRAEDFAANIDLSNRWDANQDSFELDVHSPPGIKLAKIEPARVRVILHHKRTIDDKPD